MQLLKNKTKINLFEFFWIHSYELSDGQSRQEKGSFRDGKDANGSDIKVLSVTGSYSFVSPDGVTFQVYYTADEVICTPFFILNGKGE